MNTQLDDAPIIFFDAAPASGATNGVVGLTLVAAKHLPDQNGKVKFAFFTVAHLRCTVASAKELRNAIDRALTLSISSEGTKN